MKSGFFRTEPGSPSPDPNAKIIKSTAKPLPDLKPGDTPKLSTAPDEDRKQPELAPPTEARKWKLSIADNGQKAIDNFTAVFEKECNHNITCERVEHGGEKKISFRIPIAFDISELKKTGIIDMGGIEKFPIEGWFVPKETLAQQFSGLEVDNPELVQKRLQEHEKLKDAQVNYDYYAERGLVLITGMNLGTKLEDVFDAKLKDSIIPGEAQEAVVMIPEATLVPFGALRRSQPQSLQTP
jgi:hypothetical protein